MIDEEGSSLLAEVFNRMTDEQKNHLPPDITKRIVHFVIKNGYRLVFGRWYKQARPSPYRNERV